MVGALLMLVSGGVLAGGGYLINRYDKSIKKDNLLGDARRANGGATVDGPLNLLLVGSDSRARDESDPLAQDVWRSDVIIIAHIPKEHDRAYLISVPRDSLVEIPASTDGRWRGGKDKINAAYAFGGNGAGGFRLLAQTLSNLTGLTFDAGAVIDFHGFTRVVGVLGGVEMCVEREIKSIHTDRVFKAGCQRMDQHALLDYLRQRKQYAEDDYKRIQHHQQFLKSLLTEAKNQGVVTNPVKLDALVRAAGASLTLDTNGVPVEDLAFTLRNLGTADLVGLRVPTVSEMQGGIWYEILLDEAKPLFEAIRTETLDQWAVQHPDFVNTL